MDTDLSGEGASTAEAVAGAGRAVIVETLTDGDLVVGSLGGDGRVAVGSEGDGGGLRSRGVLNDAGILELSAVLLDGKTLPDLEGLVTDLGGVDGEDHTLTAVVAGALLAVEPFVSLAHNPKRSRRLR